VQGVLLAARLVLAAVFVVAAVAKLVDLPGSRRSLEQFGVPVRLGPAVAVVLPLMELAVAVALVPVGSAWIAALAATALLLALTAGVAAALARGVEAECHCFGRVSSRPVGPATLARNLALVGVALFVVVAGAADAGTSATGWVGELSTFDAMAVGVGTLLALGLAFNAAFLFQLFRQNGRLWAELEELRAATGRGSGSGPVPEVQLGEFMPAFELPDLAGRLHELEDLLDDGNGLLLFFTDPGCSACDPLLPEVARRQRDPGDGPRPVLISVGDADRNRAKVSEHGFELVLLQEDFELPRRLGINGMPGAVVLDSEGRVASEPALGAERVGALLATSSGPPQLVQMEGAA
jgi:uncharacterized membrane protein YphA (DoxX/SURF4 family)/peroxiredoxin